MFIIGSELCLLRFEMLYELRKYQKQDNRKLSLKEMIKTVKKVLHNFLLAEIVKYCKHC